MISHHDIEIGDYVLIDWHKFNERIETVYGGRNPYDKIWPDWYANDATLVVMTIHGGIVARVTDGQSWATVPMDWLHKIY